MRCCIINFYLPAMTFIFSGHPASAQKHDNIIYLTDREILLEGATNFRDIGGYPAADGRTVKWDRLYRSGDISGLTEDDQRKLDSLGIKVVYDLRSSDEYSQAPDRLPDGVLLLQLTGAGEAFNPAAFMSVKNAEDARNAMLKAYSDVRSLSLVYKPLFGQLLLLDEKSSILFHCTAGKDRTGIAAALILSALGVERDLIISDYEATNIFWRSRNLMEKIMTERGAPEGVFKPVLEADAAYIKAFFSALEQNYGSMDSFLEQELGLTPEKLKILRSEFLE